MSLSLEFLTLIGMFLLEFVHSMEDQGRLSPLLKIVELLNNVVFCLMESGRNNVITGVAKAINTHFRKNPLAIVNVKGRAKGTTVEEVVFELEVCILLESASLLSVR